MLIGYLLIMLIAWIAITIYLLINTRKISFLRSVIPDTDDPPLTIIIAVRNEEADLEQALKSVCNLNYGNYKIVVVNDRSTDSTPHILEKLLVQYPQIVIETITQLPPRWLGKNYALYRGYQQSTTDWLLFTDADIVFDGDTLKKAMTYATTNQLDHLTLFPDVQSRSALLNSVLHTFAIMFDIKIRPWAAKDPKSGAYIGVGAFNLVKRTSYYAAGTHQAIKLRPDDDLKLGELIKKAGFKQDVLMGTDEIKLEWYTSTNEFIKGLMKNTFSVSNYNLLIAFFNALATLLVFWLPIPLGLLSGSVNGVLLGLGIMLVQWCLFYFKPGKTEWWCFLTIPLAGGIMAYILIRSALLTVKNNGIYWRDSFYSLDELRDER